MEVKLLVRGALLLAVGALSQQLRLVLPLPVPVLTLRIGTLVNTVRFLSSRYTSSQLAWVTALALPVIAFFQGHIQPFLIPVIFLGNGIYVELTGRRKSLRWTLFWAPAVKSLVLGLCLSLGQLLVLQLPPAMLPPVLAAFLPFQWLTGMAGVLLGQLLEGRIHD